MFGGRSGSPWASNARNGIYTLSLYVGWNTSFKGDNGEGFRLCETMESIRMVETGLKRIV